MKLVIRLPQWHPLRRSFGTTTRLLNCEALFPLSWGNESRRPSIFRKGTVVMLNSPQALPKFFEQLWTEDSFRVCADGAANRLFDASVSRPHLLPPQAIVGDFDSARPDVLQHYERLGCAVARRPSQGIVST
jgi:hypothetical protein